VLSGRGLCDELITRPEESYRLNVCDLITSRLTRPWTALDSVGPQRDKETNEYKRILSARYEIYGHHVHKVCIYVHNNVYKTFIHSIHNFNVFTV
jgi:hypothetical protein